MRILINENDQNSTKCQNGKEVLNCEMDNIGIWHETQTSK